MAFPPIELEFELIKDSREEWYFLRQVKGLQWEEIPRLVRNEYQSEPPIIRPGTSCFFVLELDEHQHVPSSERFTTSYIISRLRRPHQCVAVYLNHGYSKLEYDFIIKWAHRAGERLAGLMREYNCRPREQPENQNVATTRFTVRI